MKTSFYIKLFGAFAIFIMILLLFINVAFNNFYSIYGSKIELKKVEYILDTQALKFENYIKNEEEWFDVFKYEKNNIIKCEIMNGNKDYRE